MQDSRPLFVGRAFASAAFRALARGHAWKISPEARLVCDHDTVTGIRDRLLCSDPCALFSPHLESQKLASTPASQFNGRQDAAALDARGKVDWE